MLQLTCHRHSRRPYCRQQAQHPTFCALLTLQRTSSLALSQDPSPSCSILTFGRLSLADHIRAFFSPGDYSTVLLWTTSTRFDLRETFITTFYFTIGLFLLGPYSPLQILFVMRDHYWSSHWFSNKQHYLSLLWERVVFCFRVVSCFVYINLILEWTITHSFLFLCSIFFSMYSFEKNSSSFIDSSLQHALDLFRVLCPCQFLEGDMES